MISTVTFERHVAAGRSIIGLHGEHDISTTDQLRQALAEVARRDLVVIDFSGCSFLDASVLGVLAAIRAELVREGGQLVGMRATGLVAKVLHVAGFDDLLGEGLSALALVGLSAAS